MVTWFQGPHMSTLPRTHLTEAEYLEIERKAEYKNEYYQGEMFPIDGARAAHNVLALNLGSIFQQQLRHRSCQAYPGDMRVRVPATAL
jgi:Putative restriction endonuclease